MKILVTGATGFLGSHLCRYLAIKRHAVTIFRRPNSDIELLSGLDIRHKVGELTDAASVDDAVRDQDAVIHAAAARGEPARGAHVDINVQGTKNIVQACLRNHGQRLVHVSSVAAIGISEGSQPVNETFRFNLERSGFDYQVSKYQAESIVAEAVSAGLDAIVVNPAWIWGPHGSSYRGEEIIAKVRHQRILHCPPAGVCTVHVDDVVDGIVAAMECGVRGNRYILGGDNLTFRQLMERIAVRIGAARTFIPMPERIIKLAARTTGVPGGAFGNRFSRLHARLFYLTHFCHYDSSKARLALGYRPRPFDSMLEEYLNFHLEN